MRTRLGTRGALHRSARHAESGGAVRSLLGSLLGSLLLLAALAAGLFVAWATTVDFLHTVRSRSWPTTDCLILSSGVEVPDGGDQEFVFLARFRYRAGGAEHTSERVRLGYYGSDDSADAYRMAAAYPAGARVTCWYDPEDPGTAFLEHRSLWHGLVILAAVPFIAIGAGGLWLLWGGRLRRRGREPRPSPVEALGRKWTGGNAGCLAAFFGVFLAAGLGFLWLTLIGPGLRAWNARDWVATRCEVVSSHVETHPSDDGEPTYSVEVLYRYRVEGREYHSNRYHFQTGSTGGYDAKAKVVERLPAGARFTCWVDPDDPAEAVVERGLGSEAWISLVPLVFVIVGGGGMFFALTAGRRKKAGGRKRSRRASRRAASTEEDAGAAGSRVLEPAHGPWTRVLVTIFIAAFWNGITGVFVWQATEGWRSGSPDGCLTLFILPFVLIGLLLLISVPYSLLALANPRPRLILTPGRVPPGGRGEISWSFSGAARRIRKLRIRIDAERSTTTGSGKNRRTTTEELHTQTLVETEQRPEIERSNAAFVLSADAPPTSSDGDGKITWKLKLRGEIRLWPDVNEEFVIVVPDERPPRAEPPAEPGPPIPPPEVIWEPPPAPLPGDGES